MVVPIFIIAAGLCRFISRSAFGTVRCQSNSFEFACAQLRDCAIPGNKGMEALKSQDNVMNNENAHHQLPPMQ